MAIPNDPVISDLSTVVDGSAGKFICYTTLSGGRDSWSICTSDGIAVWKTEFSRDELEAQVELQGVLCLETLCSKIRSAFKSGDVQVSQERACVTLTLLRGAQALSFELFEAKAAETRTCLQHLLLNLASQVQNLQQDLERSEKKAEALSRGRGGGAGHAHLQLAEHPAAQQAKAPPKAAGMSAINPASRKRKVPKGVVWDEDEED